MVERKPPTIEMLREFKKKIEKKYGIKKMILFGSLAKGEQKEDSDVDFIVVSEKFKGKNHLKRSPSLYLEWNFGYPVDFICFTPEEFEKLKKRVSIVSEALHEGIEIN